jgi:hypothetical protein
MSYDVVNGYICKNCTDIDYAKRNIDPQHPKDGPFGVNKTAPADHGPAVVLGGALGKSAPPNGVAAVNPTSAADRSAASAQSGGGILDLKI